jgi:hypothetical protein
MAGKNAVEILVTKTEKLGNLAYSIVPQTVN